MGLGLQLRPRDGLYPPVATVEIYIATVGQTVHYEGRRNRRLLAREASDGGSLQRTRQAPELLPGHAAFIFSEDVFGSAWFQWTRLLSCLIASLEERQIAAS
jgi:hypothetical protein